MGRSTDVLSEHYALRYREDEGEQAPLPPRSVAEEDAAIASAALDAGNLPAAYHALAGALMIDPFEPSWLAMLDRALDEDASYLLDAPMWSPAAGNEALRAYAHHRRGELTRAIDVITYAAYDWRLRFAEAWGLPWLSEDGALQRCAKENALKFLEALAKRYPDPPGVTAEAQATMGQAHAILAGIVDVEGPTDQTVILEGRLLAKAGRTDEAITLMERHAEARPSMLTATAAAMAHQRSGDVEGALRWFRRGADLDPDRVFCLLDMGDLCVAHGDFARALAAYEEALGREADHPWALPSALYCRARLTGDSGAREELRYMANAGPCTCGAADALAQITGGYSYEDRRRRAEALMRELEPGFVPTHRPHAH